MGTIYEVVGDVMGDIMGEEGGGYYEEGVGAGPAQMGPIPGSWRHGAQQARFPSSNVQAPPAQGAPSYRLNPNLRMQGPIPMNGNGNGNGQSVMIAQRPDWRNGQAAPGVMLPDEGMVPLGMVPDNSTGIFTAAGATKITWIGRLQKPFRAERLLVSSVRTGATATGRLLGQFFVGVDLNMATLQSVDIELYGAATAFGTRLTLLQAPPGVEISVPTTLSNAVTGTDTVYASVQWSGRIIH